MGCFGFFEQVLHDVLFQANLILGRVFTVGFIDRACQAFEPTYWILLCEKPKEYPICTIVHAAGARKRDPKGKRRTPGSFVLGRSRGGYGTKVHLRVDEKVKFSFLQ